MFALRENLKMFKVKTVTVVEPALCRKPALFRIIALLDSASFYSA